MSFFLEIDTLSIFEKNASRIEALEMRQARRLMREYRLAAESLKTKLLAAPDNSFTEARLQATLAEVEATLSILKRRVKGELDSSFKITREQGIEDSVREVSKLEKHFTGVSANLPIDDIIDAINPENYLFNQFESSIDTYSAGVRNRLQSILTQGLIQKKPWTMMVYEASNSFPGEEWQLARIVRTELHNIYGVSKMNGFLQVRQDHLPDLKKTLYHPLDARTGEDSQFLIRNPLIVDIDEPFRYKWKGKMREFMNPPDRPNDRSILIPYREAWE